eukprot:2084047-Amphidinium_carterae.1
MGQITCQKLFAWCYQDWVSKYPDSIYYTSPQTYQERTRGFPTVDPLESRGAKPQGFAIMSHAWTDEGDCNPQAFAVQELQVLPKDVDRHFSELAKAHPISMKAVRMTEGREKEKWKESMSKELKGLIDHDTYNEVSADTVPLAQVQNAPARMVYVVKPGMAEDGTIFVERKSSLGLSLSPYKVRLSCHRVLLPTNPKSTQTFGGLK